MNVITTPFDTRETDDGREIVYRDQTGDRSGYRTLVELRGEQIAAAAPALMIAVRKPTRWAEGISGWKPEWSFANWRGFRDGLPTLDLSVVAHRDHSACLGGRSRGGPVAGRLLHGGPRLDHGGAALGAD